MILYIWKEKSKCQVVLSHEWYVKKQIPTVYTGYFLQTSKSWLHEKML